MLDQRGQLLRAAVAFAGLPATNHALDILRSYLDSWSGIGRIAVGMAHQGYDLQLTRYDERGWQGTFYTTGMEHSPTSAPTVHSSVLLDSPPAIRNRGAPMRRIELAVVLALNLLLDSLKVYRLGYLSISQTSDDVFRQGLRDLGYVIYRGPLAAALIAPEAVNG